MPQHSCYNPSNVIRTIEDGLRVAELELEANQLISNNDKCREIKNRISDTRVYLSMLYLRRWDGSS